MEEQAKTARPQLIGPRRWGVIPQYPGAKEGDVVTVFTKSGKTFEATLVKPVWTAWSSEEPDYSEPRFEG